MSLSSALGLAGNYFFGPIGGFIGSTLGTLLTPTEDIVNYGPRLQDRKVTTTGYGQAIPIVYGTMQMAGHIIEPKDFSLTETVHKTEESGGKGGGPSVTNVSYTYSATFAALLSEGSIIGVRKIWFGATLVYDFSTSATAEAIYASNKAAEGIRIYTGSETQEVDSILESLNGVGNTPAYRGSAYIVFENMQLEKYGNRLPNIRVEVVGSGSKVVAGLLAEDTSVDVNLGDTVITTIDNGVVRFWDKVETDIGSNGVIYLLDINGNYLGQEPVAPKSFRVVSQDNYPIDRASLQEIGTLGSGEKTYFVYQGNSGNYPESGGGPLYLKALLFDPSLGDMVIKNFSAELPPDRYVIGLTVSADNKRLLILQGDTLGGGSSASGLWSMYDENCDLVDSGTSDYSGISAGSASAADFGYGNTQKHVTFGMSSMESDYIHIWSGKTTTVDTWIINGSVFEYDARMPDVTDMSSAGLNTIYADGGICIFGGTFGAGPEGYFATMSREELYSTTSATLSDIVDDIEERAGVTSSNRDNSALTDSVDGYMIARQTVARRAIEPLQTAFFFDAIETGYKLKAIKRGGASVATIDVTEMGAIEYGSEAVYPLIKTRLQETELPIEVVCQYISPGRDYEVGIQRSRRIETQSAEKKNIDIPISMTDDKVKQIVEVLHFNYWAERNLYTFSLMPKYTYLDPSDVITVTDGGDTHTIRIVRINLTPGGIIQCEGVADRPALYVSDSEGVDNTADAVTLTEIGPTRAVYGDWPMLTNGQNDQALYIAVTGILAGWRGGIIYRSLDEGASYLQAATVVAASTLGYTTDALPDGDFSTFDYASTVNVNLLSGTLSSSTKLAVLNGANAIMIGAELIQFVTATLEADGTYTLATLLRGRKGTEWAMADHAIGEDAVLLDITIRRPPATLNIERKYKAVSIGNFLADSVPENVTYTGVNLKPYAPAHIEGDRVSGGNLNVDWIPRSRFETAPLWSPVIGEDSEEYEIDIYDSGWVNILRVITGLTSPDYTYTAADQTTDFGSPPADVNLKIYQKSATVGRGYEGSATV